MKKYQLKLQTLPRSEEVPTQHLGSIRCGIAHSGNDRVVPAGAWWYECVGCGRLYTQEAVLEAVHRTGQKGSNVLYDAGVGK